MTDKKKSKKKVLFFFVAGMCLLIAVAFAIYFNYMKKQQIPEKERTPRTEEEKLIAKDLEMGYPETPKEVVRLFCRMNQCIYNTALSEEKLFSLVAQLRKLYSEKLKEENPQKKMQTKISADVEKYKKEKKVIVNYTVDEPGNYRYKTIDGCENVYVKYSYFMRDGSKYSTWKQKAVLVKENDKWKIMGFGSLGKSKDKKDGK